MKIPAGRPVGRALAADAEERVEERRRHPRLEHEPAAEVDAAQEALAALDASGGITVPPEGSIRALSKQLKMERQFQFIMSLDLQK